MAASRKRVSATAQQQMECEQHGACNPCMICQHLREGRRLGYILIETDPGRLCQAALCEQCEQLLLAEDGWTDRLFDYADWQLYCEECLRRELRRRRHRLVGRGRLAPEEQ